MDGIMNIKQRLIWVIALLAMSCTLSYAQPNKQFVEQVTRSIADMTATVSPLNVKQVEQVQQEQARLIALSQQSKLNAEQKWYLINLLLQLALHKNTAQAWEELAHYQASYEPNIWRAVSSAYHASQLTTDANFKAKLLTYTAELYSGDSNLEINDYVLDVADRLYQEAISLDPVPEYQQEWDNLIAQMKLDSDESAINADQAQPEFCITLSRKLKSTSTYNYADYVRIEPKIALTIKAVGQKLCVKGMVFGEKYSLRLLKGLAAEDSRYSLKQDEIYPIVLGDRTQQVAFNPNKYIVPALGEVSVPLNTVNVDHVQLQVFKVNDRALTGDIADYWLKSEFRGGEKNQLADKWGEKIWQGSMKVNHIPNKEVTTAIPLPTVIQKREPGIYIIAAYNQSMQAEEDDYYDQHAVQWVLVSDLGISTYWGTDGLTTIVRSIATAAPLAGVKLELVARNNAVLSVVTTDAQGIARIEAGLLAGKGGRTPVLLQASHVQTGENTQQSDYNILKLDGAAFDLSDRGSQGRTVPSDMDVYVYSDRGVYRPGETVHVTTLLRNPSIQAHQDVPLTFRLNRPDQLQFESRQVGDQGAGSYATDFVLPNEAQRGQWQLLIYADPTQDAIHSLPILVEDYIPQQLRVTAQASGQSWVPQQNSATVDVASDFLYGAPAQGLSVEGSLSFVRAQAPYKGYEQWHFGKEDDELDGVHIALPETVLDELGKARINIPLDHYPQVDVPLDAVVYLSVMEPGGRPVTKVINQRFHTKPYDIGIRPLFEDDTVSYGGQAHFEVIVLDQQTQPINGQNLRYRIVQEEHNYYWYHNSWGNWQWQRERYDGQEVAQGELTSTGHPVVFHHALKGWGDHRLEVMTDDGVISSYRFYSGWRNSTGSEETPDQLSIRFDQASYQAGDIAKVAISAPFTGKASVVIASSHVHSVQNIDLEAVGSVTTVDIPVQAEWGAGVYILVSGYQPTTDTQAPKMYRAVGLGWLPLDAKDRQLKVNIDAQASYTPRQSVNIPITVIGAENQKQAFVTLTAVDEGILQITRFSSPDPLRYFYAQQQLGLSLRDIYGRLITPQGSPGDPQMGGGGGDDLDDHGNAQVPPKTVRPLALYSGIVTLDRGKASIPLLWPDFSGEVRLMAVAWTPTQLGAASMAVKVRDALDATVYVPRFMAAGDQAEISMRLQNISAPAGEYSASLTMSGPATLSGDQLRLKVTHPDDLAQQLATIQLKIDEQIHASDAQVSLDLIVKGPHDFQIKRQFQIGLRSARQPIQQRLLQLVPAQQSQLIELSALSAHHLLPLSPHARLTMNVSTLAPLGVSELLSSLSQYPYGCLEQTISRAMPLLYEKELGARYAVAHTPVQPQVIEGAIKRVLTMQSRGGSFNLWPNENRYGFYEDTDTDSRAWNTAYAVDFLTQAKLMQFAIANGSYQQAISFLQQYITRHVSSTGRTQYVVYALYSLARAGEVRHNDIRYIYDNYRSQLVGVLPKAQLAAALVLAGQKTLAQTMLDEALSEASWSGSQWGYYGSVLRDRAAVLALALAYDLQVPDLNDRILQISESISKNNASLSTQEQLWGLMLAKQLSEGAYQQAIDAQLAGQPLSFGKSISVSLGQTLTNRSSQDLWMMLVQDGIPVHVLPAKEAGYKIKRRYYDMAGQLLGEYDQSGHMLSPPILTQGDKVVVVLEGRRVTRLSLEQSLLVDWLPAGLEIDNASLTGAQHIAWLGTVSQLAYQEARDDRFIAALRDVQSYDEDEEGSIPIAVGHFKVAYIAQAVTKGEFALPAAVVEDMYLPAEMARTAEFKLIIRSAGQ